MTRANNGQAADASFTSVADRVRRSAAELTPAERRVGRTLIAAYPVAGLSTVAELASASGTSSATVVRVSGGEALLTDGPFVEGKEHIGGFTIVEAPDLDVALKLMAEGSKACNRRLEVRPILPPPHE